MNDVVEESLCFSLADNAERARWRMADIPWDCIEREKAPPELCALVREVAFSELTTTSATRRFLEDMSDDVDFTQWISVWFFEETRHPQVLVRWLHHVGVTVDQQFMKRGRATAPLMKSRFGTLVANIISEITASASYANLVEKTDEPVLQQIARHLSTDEARHAAGFYAYARKHLERSRERDADRRDALKVLYLWFQEHAQVRHPVSEFYARTADARAAMHLDPGDVRARAYRMIGSLIDVPLTAESDVLAHVGRIG